MRNTEQRVEFFKLFARVMLYLTSGKAHVGYLFDYDENPIHRIVSPNFDQFFLTKQTPKIILPGKVPARSDEKESTPEPEPESLVILHDNIVVENEPDEDMLDDSDSDVSGESDNEDDQVGGIS